MGVERVDDTSSEDDSSDEVEAPESTRKEVSSSPTTATVGNGADRTHTPSEQVPGTHAIKPTLDSAAKTGLPAGSTDDGAPLTHTTTATATNASGVNHNPTEQIPGYNTIQTPLNVERSTHNGPTGKHHRRRHEADCNNYHCCSQCSGYKPESFRSGFWQECF
jgi:hypothetical protein